MASSSTQRAPLPIAMITLLIIAFVIAQFTPWGQAFFSTNKGAATIVAVSAVVIATLLPGLLTGQMVNLLFIGIWGYVAYPRLEGAKRYMKTLTNRSR